jgi:NADH-quinone oxidoreductase subunit G
MCLVEIEKISKPVVACFMPISSNMKIFTNTHFVKKIRENVLEFLLLNHPLDCPICDQGGECDLQEQVFNFGSDKSRFFEKKRIVEDKQCGPLIKTIMTRCIHCTKCVRFISEITETNNLGIVNRGQQSEITTFIKNLIINEFSGNLIDLCPVGALTSKPYAFVARPWELKSVDSIDIFDSLATNIQIEYKESKIFRILPRFNKLLKNNKEWITDKIRFSYDGFYKNRLINPIEQISNSYRNISWEFLIKKIKILFNNIHPSKICLILSNNIDLETSIASKNLAENFGICKFVHDQFIISDNTISNIYTFNTEFIEKSDCFFLIGTNPRLEASLLNLQIKKNIKVNSIFSFNIGSVFNFVSNHNKFISLNIQFFFKILEGKNKYSKIFKKSKLPIIIYGLKIINKIEMFQFVNNIKFFSKKINIINQNLIKFLPVDSNIIGNFNLGISSFLPEIFNNTKLIYLIHPNIELINFTNSFFKYKNNLPIVIYQGTHFFNMNINIDYCVPGKIPFEKEGTYFNIENKCQKISKIFEINNNTRKDYIILQILNNSVSSLNFNFIIMELIPFFNFNKTKNIHNLIFFKEIKINKNFLKPIFEDFYNNNIILQNSLIMGKCSNINKKFAYNFLLSNN